MEIILLDNTIYIAPRIEVFDIDIKSTIASSNYSDINDGGDVQDD